jgi:hypothetical protein
MSRGAGWGGKGLLYGERNTTCPAGQGGLGIGSSFSGISALQSCNPKGARHCLWRYFRYKLLSRDHAIPARQRETERERDCLRQFWGTQIWSNMNTENKYKKDCLRQTWGKHKRTHFHTNKSREQRTQARTHLFPALPPVLMYIPNCSQWPKKSPRMRFVPCLVRT